MINKILTILIALFIIGCQNQNDLLIETLENIIDSWDNKKLQEFAQSNELIAIGEIDYDFAKQLRNNLLRNAKDTSLVSYFHLHGIYDENQMGRIISISLHRKLNNKPINLKEQLNLLHYENIEEKKCKDNNVLRAEKYYNNYSVSDTIFVRMAVNENKNIIEYSCPETANWIYNDDVDLIILGIIKEKKEASDLIGKSFLIEIISLNRENPSSFMTDLKPEGIISIELEHNIIDN